MALVVYTNPLSPDNVSSWMMHRAMNLCKRCSFLLFSEGEQKPVFNYTLPQLLLPPLIDQLLVQFQPFASDAYGRILATLMETVSRARLRRILKDVQDDWYEQHFEKCRNRTQSSEILD